MTTPYWGQLPGPKVVQSRRSSANPDDLPSTDHHRSSLDVPPPARKPNRVSVQTTNTEAPTETTFSPYDSPTASSFAPQGLAPRPTSYQRGAPRDQASDRKSSGPNQSRNPEYYDDDPSQAEVPPAAPEAPSGPSVSYHHPYGDGGLPYTYTAAGPYPANNMDSQDYYNGPVSGRYGPSEYAPENGARRDSNAVPYGQPRQGQSSSSGRRRKFADDRSPLQRLELTLDSMTKEEKRARVEAAERRARERKAREAREAQEAGEILPEPQPRYDDRQTSAHYDDRRPVGVVASGPPIREAPVPRQVSMEVPRDPSREIQRDVPPEMPMEMPRDVPVQRQTSTRHAPPPQHHGPPPQDIPEYYGTGALQEPDYYEPVQQPIEHDPAIPKRNLSFRERAARENVQYAPQSEPAPMDILPVPAPAPAPAPSNGFSLARNGSNKLKKDPPADTWARMRMEAERPNKQAQQNASIERYDDPAAVPRSIRDKSLPPDPPVTMSRRTSVDIGPGKGPIFVPADHLQGVRRRATEPVTKDEYDPEEEYVPRVKKNLTFVEPEDFRQGRRRANSDSSDSSHHHRFSNMIFKRPEDMRPGDGLYKKPEWLDEWRHATVGTLSGSLLDLVDNNAPISERNKAWWEEGTRPRNNSLGSRPKKAEAFDGEYDESNGAPTRFKPPLYLKCGPLLRYCGIRREKIASRTAKGSAVTEKELWRGSVMIVTRDSDSSYDIAPTLRLFLQDIELLPPPPQRVKGELPPEYVDPIAGHPKLGRRGGTLYVRPVDHLEEAKDLSRDETDDGLFETIRSPPEVLPQDGSPDPPGSFASRRKRVGIDGEKVGKYKDVRGFRLHAERGYTFWRFNIEVELQDKMQRIAYRINRGPSMGFWVPSRGRTMNIMFHSCNGFSLSVKPNELSGPDPMWRDVLNTHQTQPFHVMIGGGDQIYNDCVATETELFKEWLRIRNPLHKHTAALTPEMQDELEGFYLERYCMWFSQGLFGLANSQIPMVNMFDDHDIYDGYGSYPHHDMRSPVFSGLGAVAFKYYMLFQQQSIIDETENSEPSWIIGTQPGPYINELSRSLFMSVGGKTSLLAVDARTERTEHDVISNGTWEKIMNCLYAEIRRGQVEHLLVLLGVPIAYPRLVWLENILTSRLMDPVKALGRTGIFGNVMNNIDGGVEVLDDLNDHWTAKNHKQERSIVIEDLQDLAIDKSLRVTFLSGDVHLAAVGQFYSNPKLGLAKHKDPRYMPNIIASAIVNTPPPDLLADVLNKRNKVHHFDKQTDESMIPMFHRGVDGKPRNNKHLLPHRNWCSIREWIPGSTPPPSPPASDYERSPSPPGPKRSNSLLRRLSLSKTRPPQARTQPSRDSVRGSRPPVSRSGGLFRSLSRRNSVDSQRTPAAKLTRSMSVGGGEQKKSGFFSFGRRNSQRNKDDGGINGTWGDDTEDEDYWLDPDRTDQSRPSGIRGGGGYNEDARGDEVYFSVRPLPEPPTKPRPSGLRGGAAYDEYTEGDDSYFMAHAPRRSMTVGEQPPFADPMGPGGDEPPTRPFYRTPTGLSTKQKRNPETFNVDLEGGLDVCLNVEVNSKDPAGITVPYRLLVPRLQYEYNGEDDDEALSEAAGEPQPTGFKRLLSFRRKPEKTERRAADFESDEEGYDEEGYQTR